MREGWEVKRLGEVILQSGTVDPTKSPDKTFRYVDVSSVSNQTFEIAETSEIIGRDAPSRARRQIKSGDVIFATIRPTLKRIAMVPPHLDGEVCSTGYFVFRPKPNLDRKFLYYHLFTDEFMGAMERIQTGASYPAVNDTQVKDQKIAFPPLPEQKRIVAILHEAFEGIATAVANAEQNLANARELFESYLNSVFTQKGKGWVERKLGEIGKTQYGLSEKMNENRSGFKIFRMGEVQNGQLVDTGMMKYADITQDEFEKYKLYSGDVLFNRTNSYELVGKTGIFNLDGDYCFASYLVRLNFDRKKMMPGFLNYFMNSSIFQEKIKQKASRSINQANINATILSNENIQFPVSISEQQAIVRKLDALSSETQRLEAIYQQKLDGLAEMKQAVLQKAFAGELTAQPEQFLQEAVA